MTDKKPSERLREYATRNMFPAMWTDIISEVEANERIAEKAKAIGSIEYTVLESILMGLSRDPTAKNNELFHKVNELHSAIVEATPAEPEGEPKK